MNKILRIASIILGAIIIGWIITLTIDGGVLLILKLRWFFYFTCFVYLLTLIITITNWIKTGFKKYRIEILTHILTVFSLSLIMLFTSGIIHPKILIQGYLDGDIGGTEITLYKNGNFKNTAINLFSNDVSRGKYELHGDTIVFNDKPYSNDLIPDEILLSDDRTKLYFIKKKNGEFIMSDTTFYYCFRITYSDL